MKQKILVGIITIAVALFVFFLAWLLYYSQIGAKVVARSNKYERLSPKATMRILVIGDSTAYGVGASSPENSIAGLYAKRFPDAEIINLGKNGMKTNELLDELMKIQDQRFDLIQLHIGGNDIIRFVNLNKTSVTIHSILELTSTMAETTLFASTGNLGTVQFFPPGIRPFLEYRARKARDIFRSASSKFETIYYIDFFREAEDDPFAKDPGKFYAEDFLHPSDAGYALWWDTISTTLNAIIENSTP